MSSGHIQQGDLMKIEAAVAVKIGAIKRPVITAYQLGTIVFSLYQSGKYQGENLSVKQGSPQRVNYKKLIENLESSGVLSESPQASHPEIFAILAQHVPTAEEFACCINPFCYVSHLSAMEYHGFTDRLPKILFLSAPEAVLWRQLATEKMKKDLGEFYPAYLETGFPRLRRLVVKKIAKKMVSIYTSKMYDSGAYITVQGKALRVSSIGRTFLDMIRQPALCGGIYHVLDIYRQNAERYLRLIVNEADRHGTLIDKIRVGYVLDERLGLSHPALELWAANAQRGGSRKLMAENPYAPSFSEKWGLSINIEETE